MCEWIDLEQSGVVVILPISDIFKKSFFHTHMQYADILYPCTLLFFKKATRGYKSQFW